MNQCPYCQHVFATPPDRYCPNCGGDLQAAPAVATQGRPVGNGTPWERRDQIGAVAALVETTRAVLMTPVEFFSGMPVTGGVGAPLVYGLILGYVGLVAASIYSAVLQGVMGSSMGALAGREEFQRFMPLMTGTASLIARLILGPIFIVVVLFLSSGIIHLCLMLFGGARRGFEATFRTLAYGQAAAVFQIVPICGGLVTSVYGLVLAIIGLSEAHQISKGKAAAAVFLPIVILCCCCVGSMAMMFGGLAALFGQAGNH